MSRIQKVEEIYNRLIPTLRDTECWQQTLRRAAQFWKLSFAEAMLLTEQKPDATMCATLEQWNKAQRYVRRGEKSIAVFKSPADTQLRYLFDISQTYGVAVNTKWRMTEKMANGILHKINEENNTSFTNFEEYIQFSLDKKLNRIYNYYTEQIPAMANDARVYGLIYRSAMCMCLSRCGIDAEYDFSDISKLKSEISMIDIGRCAADGSREVLREIDGMIRRKEYERQLHSSAIRGGHLRHSIRGEERTAVSEAGEQGAQGYAAAGAQSDRPDDGAGQDGTGMYQHERTVSDDMGRNRGESRSSQRGGVSAAASSEPEQGLYNPDGNGQSGSGSSVGGNPQLRSMAERGMQVENDNSGTEEYSPVDDDELSSSEEYDEAVSDNDTAFEYPEADLQLSLFSDAAAPVSADCEPAQQITDSMIDHSLRCGACKRNSVMRIVQRYLENRPMDEIEDFLKKEYNDCFNGFIVNVGNADVAFSAHYSKQGIEYAAGEQVYGNISRSITWKEAAERISAMLERGEYTDDETLTNVAQEYRYSSAANALWFLDRDISADFELVPNEMYNGGYSGATENIKNALKSSAELPKYIERCAALVQIWSADKDVLRWGCTVNPAELLNDLQALQKECREYPHQTSAYDLKLFITEDEKDAVFIDNAIYSDGKRTIGKYFSAEHTLKEKADFLKNHYGIGGMGRLEFETSYDAKGYLYSKTLLGVTAKTAMKWSEVAERIDKLISQGRYITQDDINNWVNSAIKYVVNKSPRDQWEAAEYNHTKELLTEYGYNVNEIIKAGRAEIYAAAITEYSEFAVNELKSNAALTASHNGEKADFNIAAATALDNLVNDINRLRPSGWSNDRIAIFTDKLSHDGSYKDELYLSVLTELDVRLTAKESRIEENTDDLYVTVTSDAFSDPADAFAIWDNRKNDYYTASDGNYDNVLTFPTEEAAQAALEAIRGGVQKTAEAENAPAVDISEKEKSFAEQVDASLNGTLPFYTNLKLGDTPEILLNVGLRQLPMLYTQKHLKNAVAKRDDYKHTHGLSVEQIKGIPEKLKEPIMIYDSFSRNDSVVAVINDFDSDSNPIIVSIKPDGRGRYEVEEIESNFVTSIYSKENFQEMLKRLTSEDKLLYCDKKQTQEMFERWGLQLSELTNAPVFNTIIHQSRNIVKSSEEKISEEMTAEGKPQRLPSITCNWSESSLFKDGKTYFVAEFDSIMAKADKEKHDGRAAGLEKYGSEEKWREQDEESYFAHLGYDKTNFTVNLPNGDSITERQDIGDGYGGVIEFLAQYDQYTDLAEQLRNAAEAEITEGIFVPEQDEIPEKEKTVAELFAEAGITEESPFVVNPEVESELQARQIEQLGSPENYTTASNELRHDVPAEDKYFAQNQPPISFHFPQDFAYSSGKKAKFNDNIAAIKVLRAVEHEHRTATSDEQQILARYSGWGGISEAFDADNDSWQSEYAELKALLSASEYKAARASSLTAFYTDPYIIKSIFAALEQFGFTGGRILDPSMGTGNFFGNMPQQMLENSRLYGVELDSLTAKIARLLYPAAEIQNKGFEQTKYDNDTFDVVIGNVPFGSYKPYDASYDEDYYIHDYFFIKSLDKLKPGGIAALITSSGTLDKYNNSAKREMYKRADLIGAVRLPNNAFKSAGTEVVTDIVFFKKLEQQRSNDEVLQQPNWLSKGSVRIDDAWYSTNKYFADNPDKILGTVKTVSGQYGAENTIVSDGDISEQLKRAISTLSARFEAEPTYDEDFTDIGNTEKEMLPDGVRPYTYFVQDGALYYGDGDEAVQIKDAKAEERIRLMCDIVTHSEHIIAIQRDGCTDDELLQAQEILTRQYDTFVQKYGNLNSPANRRAFQDDVRIPRLLSLETEVKGADNKVTYRKADIFTRRTVNQRTEPTHAANALEALYHSLNYKQRVDIPYMAALCGKTCDDIITELGDRIYCNPAKNLGDKYSGWEMAEEYLSGYTRDKLELAVAKAEENPEMFARNVEALKEHQPPHIPITDIGFRLGSIYIPQEMFTQFMYDTFDTHLYHRSGLFAKQRISCEYISAMNEWRIPNKRIEHNVKVDEMYGTKRLNAYELTELTLNQRRAEVKDLKIDSDGNEHYVLNRDETILAREKQTKIENAFREWVFAHDARIKSIEDIYNDTYNAITPRTYDGSYIDVPGLAAGLSLRPHQKNAIARFTPSKCALVAHGVGAGKTSFAAAHGMYYKSMGAIKKPLYVIPNAVIGQFCEEFYRFFPEANILCATEKDFEKSNRRKFLSKISVGNYDAVLISQSQFEKIPLSLERQEEMYERKINELTTSIAEMKADEGGRLSVKKLETQRKSLENKITKLRAAFKKDDFITFEELGIDYMYIDEAHAYKNLAIFTKMHNVAGINSNSNSQRAFDLEGKIRYLQEINNGGGVALMTGTPISNAISEMFVWQYELQYSRLKELGIEYFDNWASVFGKITQSLEVKPSGSGFRMRTRFSEFVNLPELCNLFGEICDIVNTSDLNINLPKIADGKPEMIICEKSPAQEQQTEIGLERARLIENKLVKPEDDNMLAICTYMTKVALDGRIIDPNADDFDQSKVNQCVQRLLEIDDGCDRATHVIFCDTNTPKSNGVFSVYQDIKDKLVASGRFTPEEVVFVHDAKNDKQRIEMFSKANEGRIRVIIGSTSKLGTGVNIQQRLASLHHLDAPYRPSDIEQRNGRGIRQGNSNPEVHICYYATKGTFDTYRWQLLESKQRTIAQIMCGKPAARTCKDIDEVALTFAEMKAAATDNPLIAEKLNVDNEVARLTLLQNDYLAQQAKLEKDIQERYPKAIHLHEQQLANAVDDMAAVKAQPLTDNFRVSINGRELTDRAEAAKRIEAIAKKYMLSDAYRSKEAEYFGNFHGFDIGFCNRDMFTLEILLKGKNVYKTDYANSGTGAITRLENLFQKIELQPQIQHDEISYLQMQLKDAKAIYGKSFEHTAELEELLVRQAWLNAQLEFGEQTSDDALVDENAISDTADDEEYDMEM